MPRTESALPGGVRTSDLVTLGILAEHVPNGMVRRAVSKANAESQRKRTLPAPLTALYVVAMSLYRDVAYEEILRCLLEGMRWLGQDVPDIATKGAITQARARLGVPAMRFLFEEMAQPMATPKTQGAWYRSWLTVACDGTTLRVPDSKENAEAFGYPVKAHEASYPLIRCVCFCETGTHAAFAAAMRPYASSEIEMARSLLGNLKAGMLLLADRGYFNYDLWNDAVATGADMLWRVNSTWELPKLQVLSDGSWISALRPPRARRTLEPPTRVRIIQYQVKGSAEIYRLATSILDPDLAPGLELAALYAQRWEVEAIFDEMKTHLKGTALTLRSKTPQLVEQEFWGLMIAHRALRSLIHEAALKHQLDPDEISFTHAVRIVKRTLPGRAVLSP
jgi:Insertion element 4 transposase N-terminal/Transposase DDE domain